MRPLFLSNFAVARFFERGDCAMFFCISLEIKVLCQLNGLLKATMFVPKWEKQSSLYCLFSYPPWCKSGGDTFPLLGRPVCALCTSTLPCHTSWTFMPEYYT